jgi:hypothetical protein
MKRFCKGGASRIGDETAKDGENAQYTAIAISIGYVVLPSPSRGWPLSGT